MKTVQRVKQWSILTLVMVLPACGGMPILLPSQFQSQTLVIQVPSPAKIVIRQPLGQIPCTSAKSYAERWALVEAKDSKRRTVRLVPQCSQAQNETESSVLVFSTRDYVKEGRYRVRFEKRGVIEKMLRAKAGLQLDFENRNFNDGPDQSVDGAVALEPGKPLDGTVDYYAGDAHDWIRIPGQGKTVSITLIATKTPPPLVELYRVDADSGKRSKLGDITAKKSREASLNQDDLYLLVQGAPNRGALSYQLLRRDRNATKSSTIAVIDCYPVQDNQWIVLLHNSGSLKAEDKVDVSAKSDDGGWKPVGKCTVQKVEGETASCRLLGEIPSDARAYRAVGYSKTT